MVAGITSSPNAGRSSGFQLRNATVIALDIFQTGVTSTR